MFWAGLVLGLLIGGITGWCTCCLCLTARMSDSEMDDYDDKQDK